MTDTAITPAQTMTALTSLAEKLGEGGADTIAKLVGLQQEQVDRESRRALLRALSAARLEFPEIEKTYQGQHTTKKGTRTVGNYAPLHEIAKVVDPILSTHGLTYRWDRIKEDGDHFMVCILEHDEGASISAKFPAMVDEGRGRSTIQSHASGETYAKRYSLVSVLGLTCVDPDDDARATQDAPAGPTITEDQGLELDALADQVQADWPKFLKFFGIDRLRDLPESRYGEAMSMLKAKGRQLDAQKGA